MLRISIIVPTLNEALLILSCLRHLRRSASGAEIIVCDGKSHDATFELAQQSGLADQVLQVAGGRAAQLNQAIQCCSGDLIVCCPVDVRFHPAAFEQLQEAVQAGVRYGCFYQRSARRSMLYQIQDFLARLRARLCANAYMDQVPFCLRSDIKRVGGFRGYWSYDTADLFRRLRRAWQFKLLTAPCVSSCRAWQQGFWRQWWRQQQSRLCYFSLLLFKDQS